MEVWVEKTGGIVKIIVKRRNEYLYKVVPDFLLEEAKFLEEALKDSELTWVDDIIVHRGSIILRTGDREITIQTNSTPELVAKILNVIDDIWCATGALRATITSDTVLLTTRKGIITLQEWMKRALECIKQGEKDDFVIIIDKDDIIIIKRLYNYLKKEEVLRDGIQNEQN